MRERDDFEEDSKESKGYNLFAIANDLFFL